MTNTCGTCKFYSEVCPKEPSDENDYDSGLCCIKHDRLPLLLKDCECSTYVHGDWKDCPTWTAPDSALPANPRLPVGEVCNVGLMVEDVFPPVLDFALAHIGLFLSEEARMLKRWKSLPFDADKAEKRLADLHHILNTLCPDDHYFGSKIGDYRRVGVWKR